MAPSRSRRTSPLRPLILLALFLGIFLFAQRASASEPSPSASSEDLICHTDNPAECYPRVFRPTHEFQVVRDDQELPSGLHVRLNIWTGEKEAKINVPDEDNPALRLPVDRAVVLVEPEEGEQQVPIPKGAPAYEPVGQIKKPPVEEVGFWDSLKVIKKGTKGSDGQFGGALNNLLEMSNDIYYGLKITEDSDAVKALLCLMTSHSDAVTHDERQSAARIMGGALQNNAKALAEVEKVWGGFMDSQCGKKGPKLQDAFYGSLMPKENLSAEELAPAASRVGSTVFAIKGLLKSASIRDDFIANGGMKNLLEIIIPKGEVWASAQRKVGLLLLDTFLDGDVGATLGIWPKGVASKDSMCKVQPTQSEEGCWDYHVRRIKDENKGEAGHWSVEVYDKLRAARAVVANNYEKIEL